MKKLTEKDLLEEIGRWHKFIKKWYPGTEAKKAAQVYKRIVELIKIFFAKEISSGPIKKEISRPVLIEWLEGINQAATAVNDHYVMKATTQLIDMLQNMNLPEYLRGIASKQREVEGLKEHIKNIEKRCAELIQETEKPRLIWDASRPEITPTWLPTAENINALPEPVRNYIFGLETNADPPSMVADNIIMKDTIKTLEKMLQEAKEK